MAISPFSVSDMLKLLEAVPGWRALLALPRRVAELEARVAALEGRTVKAGVTCPICGATMMVTAAQPDPLFGDFGVQQHTLSCPGCSHSEKRQVET